jgi:hypothetical protein
MSLKRLDKWMEANRKKAPPINPWNCSKGMHKPEWSEEKGFFICATCKIPLSATRREIMSKDRWGNEMADRDGRHGWTSKEERRAGNSVYARILRAKDEILTYKMRGFMDAHTAWEDNHPEFAQRRHILLQSHGFSNLTEYQKKLGRRGGTIADQERLDGFARALSDLRQELDPTYASMVRGSYMLRAMLGHLEDHPDDEDCYEPGLLVLRLYNEWMGRYIAENPPGAA